MKKFLEDAIRMSVEIKEDNKIYNQLPLLFKGKYYIYSILHVQIFPNISYLLALSNGIC